MGKQLDMYDSYQHIMIQFLVIRCLVTFDARWYSFTYLTFNDSMFADSIMARCIYDSRFIWRKMSAKKGAGTRAGRGRSRYQEEQISDEEEDLVHTFDVGEKLKSKDFPRFFVSELTGEEASSQSSYSNLVLLCNACNAII